MSKAVDRFNDFVQIILLSGFKLKKDDGGLWWNNTVNNIFEDLSLFSYLLNSIEVKKVENSTLDYGKFYLAIRQDTLHSQEMLRLLKERMDKEETKNNGR